MEVTEKQQIQNSCFQKNINLIPAQCINKKIKNREFLKEEFPVFYFFIFG